VVKHLFSFALGLCSFALTADCAQSADAFALAEGDRVVLIGNTLIEREQRYGYWETVLTQRFPSVTFRNLGWSGDTVFGDARAGFGTQADGFRHLREHVLALKPTVLLIGYGTNESFEGPKGLPRFVQGFNTLLDTLAPTKARVILLSPLKQEDHGRPLPDPAENNKNLRLYAVTIRDTAAKRGCLFVDLFDLLGGGTSATPPLTENGIHLTAWGYWHTAPILERGLGLAEKSWRIEIKAEPGKTDTQGTLSARGARVEAVPLCFRVTDAMLPLPPRPRDGAPRLPSASGRILQIKGLAPGSYTLAIDGKKIVTAKADQWAAGVELTRGPEFEQAERLRQAIVAKNRLYFYRWRPENETYLFGFRKHEQGQNAREIPQFDPLIVEKEKEIANLRVPVPHTYELRAETKR
jgi:hypothetical protein